MTRTRSFLLSMTLILAAGAAAAETFGRDSVDRAQRVVDESFDLAAGGRVEVKGLGGSVRVVAHDGPRVQLHYRRSAPTQQDLDCETLRYEPAAGNLAIWVERKRGDACHSSRADDVLELTVPRAASISLSSIGDSVAVSGVTGMVQLESIGDSAVLEGVTRLRAGSIGDTLKINAGKLAPEGLRIDSIGDSVELRLAAGQGARLQVDSIGGEVHGHELHLTSLGGSAKVVLGGGGPDIRISSVGDDVVIRQ